MVVKIWVKAKWMSDDGGTMSVINSDDTKFFCFERTLFKNLEVGNTFYAEYEERIKKTGRTKGAPYNCIIGISTEEPTRVAVREAAAEKVEIQAPKALVEERAKVTKIETRGEDLPERNRSIERQTSIKASTELAVAKIAKGEEMTVNKIIEIAKRFAQFLATGD